MASVLITGIEPFDGEHINPSWEVVRQLNGVYIANTLVVARQLPCEFGHALDKLYQAIDELEPTLVICVGQAGGRAEVSIERVAININDARIPDNQGYQPIDVPIIEQGPAAYFSTLPIKALVQGLRDEGIPASVSQTAGTYVCNHIMYGLLHHLKKQGSPARGGFIHIPYLPEQAVNHSGAPSMSASTLVKAMEKIIAVSITTLKDLVVSAGATH
ncbi:pyroglutamyl-peptidase I [Pragia fontium]|uniref:Pyrrolidone-carboxylate peptidase n=1 Tax=Pragia fontium DSM 5563 = ATCC 49100 TaxID=1122977 RepID=A0AAJ4W8V7_9GAMM|nr:pyroglutamyl-peptidase I [Pragia fontium]SFC35379.1 pyroglutamyl-peptidase I . Cysteine peptidase. MEROPS family C15 [Pragia fontium DSM 5563 = ATCC 49100]SUB81964.1 Pyrrolidone-carboxylate peptidase [Pragia fontium]VEJ54550.1 Pyrrolidone-carboxylate peptidase [Pragia fontium]